jgi:hypothetical protein
MFYFLQGAKQSYLILNGQLTHRITGGSDGRSLQ